MQLLTNREKEVEPHHIKYTLDPVKQRNIFKEIVKMEIGYAFS